VGWHLTDDVEAFAERVWPLLSRDPAEQTVALTVVEAVREGRRFTEGSNLFGWHESDGTVDGAVLQTPPFELLLAAVPDGAVGELAAALRAARPDLKGVNGDAAVVDAFARVWTDGTSLPMRHLFTMRLHVLEALRPPEPPPPGRARPAREDEVALGAGWMAAFQVEAGVASTDVEAMARERIGDGRMWLWETEDGGAGAMAARTPAIGGVSRIAPVYTPPEHRRRGYGAAVTAACTADALERGAEHVVLFADVANPTSTGVYVRIGFRARSDRLVIRFDA
jgi:predicted GNAT family acetyltransferase